MCIYFLNESVRGLINAVFICYWFNEVIFLQNYRKRIDNDLQMVQKKNKKGEIINKYKQGWQRLQKVDMDYKWSI